MKLEPLFDDFLDYMKTERNASALTLEAYQRDFKIFFSFLEISDISLEVDKITTPVVRKYISYMSREKNYKSTTLCRRINSLRSFFKFLMSQEYITKNPMTPISTPTKPEVLPIYLTEAELKRLLSMPEKHSRDHKLRDLVILELFSMCGLRCSEVINLNWSDVDFKESTLTIKQAKGKKDRIVPLIEPLTSHLWQYLETRLPLTNEALILSDQGNRISVTALEQMFTRYVKLAGFQGKGYTIHKLRHTYATLLLQNDADLISLKDLLGHSDLNSTRIYCHTSVKHLQKTVARHPLSIKDK